MRVFTCTKFDGHYPVGAAAVIVAEDLFDAQALLEAKLASVGLAQKIDVADIESVDDLHESCVLLCDGNY